MDLEEADDIQVVGLLQDERKGGRFDRLRSDADLRREMRFVQLCLAFGAVGNDGSQLVVALSLGVLG